MTFRVQWIQRDCSKNEKEEFREAITDLWMDIARTKISPELVEFFGGFFSDSVGSDADLLTSISLGDGGGVGEVDFQKIGSNKIFSTVKMRR